MKKFKKIVAPILAGSLLVSALTVTASAKSLAESFYSGTNYICLSTTYTWSGEPVSDYVKTCHAGTNGYSGYHYVRAWIGGSRTAPNSMTEADTGRCWFYGNNVYSCTSNKRTIYGPWNLAFYFPTGYAKYGN